ncbi:MAG: cupin domain-containing protein, partial [Bradyrhizobium sp.]
MEAVQKTPEREAFYKKIDGENLSALWNVMGDLITPEPKSACRPHLWKFDSIRDYMTEAGKLITAKEAERRVLVLENPGLRGQSKITTSLFAGVQMVVPGDIAPAHRHSQSALRFVLEGKGAYTAVDGERTAMAPGDFVITPSMTWHDHSNETSEPMFWLDGLDIPMVQFFDASFAEGSNEDQQQITRPAGDSFARYGHNLLPVDQKRTSKTSPIFNYPYSYTREALERAKARNEWDACHGL